jgi:ABC-type nickel/cobalt efflux system permease component RcnA
VALLIALIRLFDVYVFSSHQWLTYVSIGAVFIIAGLFIWRYRRTQNAGE